jgi:hypothetical protein
MNSQDIKIQNSVPFLGNGIKGRACPECRQDESRIQHIQVEDKISFEALKKSLETKS